MYERRNIKGKRKEQEMSKEIEKRKKQRAKVRKEVCINM